MFYKYIIPIRDCCCWSLCFVEALTQQQLKMPVSSFSVSHAPQTPWVFSTLPPWASQRCRLVHLIYPGLFLLGQRQTNLIKMKGLC